MSPLNFHWSCFVLQSAWLFSSSMERTTTLSSTWEMPISRSLLSSTLSIKQLKYYWMFYITLNHQTLWIIDANTSKRKKEHMCPAICSEKPPQVRNTKYWRLFSTITNSCLVLLYVAGLDFLPWRQTRGMLPHCYWDSKAWENKFEWLWNHFTHLAAGRKPLPKRNSPSNTFLHQ